MKQANNKISSKTVEEATKIANATQKPNQTKQQTKLIAQGIQKGIELYKKQHKAKLRELDKSKKKAKTQTKVEIETQTITKQSKLAWGLLAISWVGFVTFIALESIK